MDLKLHQNPPNSTKITQNYTKIHKKSTKIPPNFDQKCSTKNHQKPPKLKISSTKKHQNPPKLQDVNECPYCYKVFSKKNSLKMDDVKLKKDEENDKKK